MRWCDACEVDISPNRLFVSSHKRQIASSVSCNDYLFNQILHILPYKLLYTILTISAN